MCIRDSPNPIALAASFNPALVEKSYRCIAKEAANCGVHWTFAPMVDRAQDPRWGRCVEGPVSYTHLSVYYAVQESGEGTVQYDGAGDREDFCSDAEYKALRF